MSEYQALAIDGCDLEDLAVVGHSTAHCNEMLLVEVVTRVASSPFALLAVARPVVTHRINRGDNPGVTVTESGVTCCHRE